MSKDGRTGCRAALAERNLWVIGTADDGCTHPREDRLELGSDGTNGYYACARCGASLVLQDEVVLSGDDPN